MRRLAVASLFLVAAVLASPAMAAPRVSVALDHSTKLEFKGAAASVIVGNPQVADVTVVDQHTLYVSGRGYGTTEIVVLDPLGRTIWKGDVVVTQPDGQVSIYRGNQATDMACGGSSCAPSIRNKGGATPTPAAAPNK